MKKFQKRVHFYLFCKVEFAKSPFTHRLTDEAELLLLWLELNNLVMQCFRHTTNRYSQNLAEQICEYPRQ